MIVIHRYSLLINHKKSSTKMMTSLETEGPSPYLVGWWLWSPPILWFADFIYTLSVHFPCSGVRYLLQVVLDHRKGPPFYLRSRSLLWPLCCEVEVLLHKETTFVWIPLSRNVKEARTENTSISWLQHANSKYFVVFFYILAIFVFINFCGIYFRGLSDSRIC